LGHAASIFVTGRKEPFAALRIIVWGKPYKAAQALSSRNAEGMICAVSRMTDWWFASFVLPPYEGTSFSRPPFLHMMIHRQ
jgi:hypothetical protein